MKKKTKTRRSVSLQKRQSLLTKAEIAASDKTLLQKLKSRNKKNKLSALQGLVLSADLSTGEGKKLRRDVFREYLGSEDPKLATWAANGLGRIGDRRAANALILKIRSPHKHLKYKAIQSLRLLGIIKAVRPIVVYGLDEPPASGLAKCSREALKDLASINRKIVINTLATWGLRNESDWVKTNSKEMLDELRVLGKSLKTLPKIFGTPPKKR